MTQPQSAPGTEPAEPVNVALLALEAGFAAQVLAALTGWLAVVAAVVLAPVALFSLSPNPGALWSTLPLWEQQVDRLIQELSRIARRGWEAAAAQLGVNLPFNPADPLLLDQLARTRNLLVRIPDEIYRTMIYQLDQAAGETPQQQADRINEILNITGSQNWPARARTIATTEVHRAYHFGALALAQRADASDRRELNKRWDARDDTKTRPAHGRADGQIAPVNQPFIVDWEALMAPGDPSGRPENVINCRCEMHFTWRNSGR